MSWRPHWHGSRSTAQTILAGAAFVAVAVSAAISTGGHLSTDSVQQLFEAKVGTSVSWNPPFMSALLGLLDVDDLSGVGVAMALFVALVVCAMWGAPLLVALAKGSAKVPVPAQLFCLLLVLNPVAILYAGIVWKDVLFAALTAFAAALSLVTLATPAFAKRFVLAMLAAAVIALLPLVRQQGWVVGPVLLVLPVLAMVWSDRAVGAARFALPVLVVVLAVVTHAAAVSWSASAVRGGDGKDLSVGFRSIQMFDLAGMEAFSREGPLVQLGAPAEALLELQQHYTPERIDFLDRCPRLFAFMVSRGDALASDWRRAVLAEPVAYATHRIEVLRALFGMHRPGACLPVHVGIYGFDHQLKALGLVNGTDVIDRQVFQLVKPMFGTPVFTHAWYASLLAVVLAIILARRSGRTRVALGIIAGGLVLFYASFVPTAIACDFRYLFPAIPSLTVLAVALCFGWAESSESPEGAL